LIRRSEVGASEPQRSEPQNHRDAEVRGRRKTRIENRNRGKREAWAKRIYETHFVNKLTDSDGENSETDTWLDFALDGGYLAASDHQSLSEEWRQIGSMLAAMLCNPRPFLLRNSDL
jgi:hypothetical protein